MLGSCLVGARGAAFGLVVTALVAGCAQGSDTNLSFSGGGSEGGAASSGGNSSSGGAPSTNNTTTNTTNTTTTNTTNTTTNTTNTTATTTTGPSCGDTVCGAGESCSTCPADCGACAVCGNGVCEAGETASCPADCSVAGCNHDSCTVGDPLDPSCSSCADLVCNILGDTTCCDTTWDDVCALYGDVYCACSP